MAWRARRRAPTPSTHWSMATQVDKAKTHIQKEGLPRFYIRTLAELEDCLDVALKDKEAQKKMSKANGRALNRMKLQLRRHNKEFETKIAEYRANPDAEEESASSSSESESSSSEDSSSSDESSDEESVEEKPKKVQKNLEDMDSDDWASSSDESESSSSEDEDTGELKGRARWLKRTVRSRRFEVLRRLPCDSWPSHDAGGGFFLEFEAVRAASGPSRRVGESAVAEMA